MIVISTKEASILRILALWPDKNHDLVEKLNFDAQRIGDLLIGRAIPVMEKLEVHHEAAKALKEWALQRKKNAA